jgi:hypothetical protein
MRIALACRATGLSLAPVRDTDRMFTMPPTTSPPPLEPILARLEQQLGSAPGGGRLSREDILVLAVMASERAATSEWTTHHPTCTIHQQVAKWLRRCSCGLEAAEARSTSLRARLFPEAQPDLRHRRKGDGRY